MNLIFFGADQYSAVALQNLLENRNTGVLEHIFVVTDKHEGGSPVENLAREHGLNVSYYPTLPDLSGVVGLCASFDHLIPQDVITQFAGNLYNLHPSLLPQYRNVSPVQYAIALGDKETGITLFRISPGIDDGKIISQASEPILESDTTATLTPHLFAKGGQLFLNAINNEFAPTGKLENRMTGELIFTHRLKKDSGYIEWPVLEKLLAGIKVESSATKNELLSLRLGSDLKGSSQPADSKAGRSDPIGVIYDLLRALTPWPGIWSLVPTKKGEIRISLESVLPDITLKLAGKPKAISFKDFEKYYL
jgi:methionyl-tRNA formyltransferase